MSNVEERKQRGVIILGAILALGLAVKLIDMEIAHQFTKNSKKKGLYAIEQQAFYKEHGVDKTQALIKLVESHPELFAEERKGVVNPPPE